MEVRLKYITPDALALIGSYASICYNSKNEPALNVKRALHCKDRGHLSTLRHAIATFHIKGISRVCSHQLVRSKFLDVLQRSQRYCKEKDVVFVMPNTSEDLTTEIKEHYDSCYALYSKLLSSGMLAEDARFVLPEATTTELVVTGNFQAWLDFINLRMDKHAQWEIRIVAREINNILATHAPGLFNWAPEITT
jgi:thymidylate synthase (FAD)